MYIFTIFSQKRNKNEVNVLNIKFSVHIDTSLSYWTKTMDKHQICLALILLLLLFQFPIIFWPTLYNYITIQVCKQTHNCRTLTYKVLCKSALNRASTVANGRSFVNKAFWNYSKFVLDDFASVLPAFAAIK